MRKILLLALLSTISVVNIFPQSIEDVIAFFSNREYSKVETLNEKEWKYAKFVFSKIDPSFYNEKAEIQLKDTLNNYWFDKVFTRKTENSNSYSLDFDKVKAGAAKITLSDIPEVEEFIFIGMKMPILEKARSITHLELKNYKDNERNTFWDEIDKIKSSYEILISKNEGNEKAMIMKNKEKGSFSQIIMIDETDDSSIDVVCMKGSFDASVLTPPKIIMNK